MKKLSAFLAVLLINFMFCVSFAGESGVAPSVISLPKGPGSIEGLGEEFEAAANTGTALYGIDIAVPEGSGGFKPSLKISYNGGRGNSPLGFGWSIPLPRIFRQTDKGLPRYDAQDAYIYQDQTVSEELVPLANQSFRLKTEGAFIRAVRNNDGWEVRTKSGIIFRLGATSVSRTKDASDRVFAWNISEMEDTNGNRVSFEWSNDRNQSYIKKIQYNNYGDKAVCEIIFTYAARQDVLSDYRATFPVTTALRLSKIDVLKGGRLVRSYNFAYDDQSTLSHLVSITLKGSDGESSMPPLGFEYTRFAPADQKIVEMQNPPGESLLNLKNALVDLNADGLPDLIATEAGDFRYYINEDGTNWSDPQSMSSNPSYDLSQDGVRLADIDGDGVTDLLVARGAEGNSYFPGTGEAGWLPSVPFDQNPVGFDLSDPDTRFMDLNGDRLIDVLRTDISGTSAWIHDGEGSFERLGSLPRIDSGEQILFSDPQIKTADFNGDGLLDVARLRSGSLKYWPSTGYGRFDGAIIMSGAPAVDDETKLQVADLNGDGLADIVYFGINQIRYWLNRGNLTLSGQYVIDGTPPIDPANTSVQFADMNGNGTADIVWVDVSKGPSGSWRYIDVVGDQFAGLITRIENGLGKSVLIEYESSTAQMARAAGGAWRLPFPVTVISKITVEDGLGGRMVSEYTYTEGYYDGKEREFWGFAKTMKTEYGDESIDTLMTSWSFDVGKTQEALKGKMLSEERTDADGVAFDRSENVWTAAVLENGTDGKNVVFASLETVVSSIMDGSNEPRYTRTDFDYDQFGNVVNESRHGEIVSAGDDGWVPFGDDEIFIHRNFAENESAWILDRVSRESKLNGDGKIIEDALNYYDGAVFQGLSLGQVESGNLMRRDKWVGTEDRYIPVVRYRRDAWGNITAILDAADGRREIFYDPESHTYPVRERIFTGDRALDFVAEYDDIFGKLKSITDPNGARSSYSYDVFGRPASLVKPGDSESLPTEQYEYNVSSPLSVTSIHARAGSGDTLDSYKFIDGLGRIRAEMTRNDADTFAVTKAALFNSRGKESFVAAPFACTAPVSDCPLYGLGLASKSGTSDYYDAVGRLIRVLNPDSTFTGVKYLPLTEIIFDENDTNPDSPHYDTPTTKRYDGQRRLILTVFRSEKEDVATRFGYDSTGNIVSVTDPAGNVRTQTYDGLGRMISLSDPNAGRREYIYNDAGNLVEKRKPDGKAIKYEYEPTTNRILAKNLVTSPEDDTWEVKYHYDSSPDGWDAGSVIGRLAWVEDEAGQEYFSYDARGRMTAKRSVVGTNTFDLAFAYDGADRQIAVTYPDATSTSLSYNDRGLLKSVGSYLSDRTYNAAGQVETETMGDGIRRTYSYDPRNRVSEITVTSASGEVLQKFRYDLDPAGNITHIDDGRTISPEKLLTQSFEYDDLYRLAKSESAEGSISWAYDSVGNITQRQNTFEDERLQAQAIRYGENGAGPYAMTSYDDKRFEYDVNGNLAQMPGQRLYFDAEDRLTGVTKEDGTKVEMRYGYDGMRKLKRVTKSDGTIVESLYVDPNYEVREGHGYKYIWADGKRIARVESSGN